MLRRLALFVAVLAVTFASHAQTCSPPTVVQIGGTNPSCPSSAVTLDAGGGWDTYAWSNGATGRYLTDVPSVTTSYSVTVTAGGCETSSTPLEITVNPTPAAPQINASVASICSYGTASAGIDGSWQAVSWTITNGFFIDGMGNRSSASTSYNPYFTPDGGTLDVVLGVTAQDPVGCWSQPGSKTIPIRPAPTTTIETDVTEICPYGVGHAGTEPPANGSWTTYVWHIDNGFFVGSMGQKTSSSADPYVTFTPDGGTNNVVIHLFAQDSLGCWTQETVRTVPIRTIPTPLIETDVTEICPYGVGHAGTEPPANGSWTTYVWHIDNGFFVGSMGQKTSSSADPYVTFTPDGGTNDVVIHLFTQDSLGCWTEEAVRTVPIRTIPTPLIETDVTEICPYGVGHAGTEPPANGSWTTYVWHIDNGFFVGSMGQKTNSSADPFVTFTPDGGTNNVVIHLFTQDSLGCWTPEAVRTVPIRTIPTPLIETDVTEICPYGVGHAGTEPPANGSWTTYVWHIDNGFFVGSMGQKTNSSADPFVTFTPDGGTNDVVIHLFTQDSLGCWTPEAVRTVPIRTIPTPLIETDVTEICPNGVGHAGTEPPASGFWTTYMWSIENGFFVDSTGQQSSTSAQPFVTFTPGGGNADVVLHLSALDGQGCWTPQATRTVPIASAAAAIIDSANSFCSSTDAQASTPDAGAGATYAWTVTNATIVSGADSPMVTFTPDGTGDVTLDVSVSLTTGCVSTGQKVVPVAPRPFFDIRVTQGGGYTATNPRVTSNADFQGTYVFCGGPVNLLATVLDPTWTYTWSTGATGPFLSVSSSGTYTLTATAPNGCSYAKAVTIDIKTPPSASISGARAFCPGGSTTLTASGGTSYLWSNGATTASITVNQAGTYSVTVSANGCSASASATVTRNEAGIVADGPTSFCGGGSVTLTANQAQSYLWSNGATTRAITVNASGAYSVQETFAEGCTLASNAISVNVGPSAASISIDDNSLCPGQTATISSTVTGGSNLTYQWLDGNLQPIAGATSPTLVFNASGSGYGHATLRVTDANGCSVDSNQVTWYLWQPVTPVITTYGPTTFCQGSMPTTLESSVATTYLWSNGATTRSISVTAPGTYTVTTTDGSGCPVTSNPVTITVLTPPAKPEIAANGPLAFCAGGSVTLTSSPASSYLWSTGATTQSITVTQAGYYSVAVSDGSCSTTSDAVQVTVNPLPAASITGALSFCEGSSTTLTASLASSYLWSNGATTRSITVTAPGAYYVTVSNGTCSATSSTVNVTMNPAPAASITGALSFCEGSSTTLTASLASSYLWSNGATTRSITVTAPGAYYVTVSDGTCSATSSTVNVTKNALPTATISGNLSFCEGSSTTLTASAGASYLWNNGATTQSITVTAPGPYYVTVSDGTCSATSSTVNVTKNALPAATISGNLSFCEGSSTTLTASAGSSYLWNNGATTQSITVTAPGAYYVTVSNGTCSATSSTVNVTKNALPTATISGNLSFCEGSSTTLTASAGSSYLWNNGATTQSITVTAPGPYYVTVSNGTCSATSSTVNVTKNALPPSTITPSTTALCPGSSATLTAPAGYAYVWNTGATTRSITVSAAGTYTVTVSNGSCSSSSSVTITANAPTQITTQPASITMPRTATRQLSVAATGTAPLTYQWYNGNSGDTSTPVTTNGTSATLTIGPYTKKGTERYWVRVSSATCSGSTVNSATAVITITN